MRMRCLLMRWNLRRTRRNILLLWILWRKCWSCWYIWLPLAIIHLWRRLMPRGIRLCFSCCFRRMGLWSMCLFLALFLFACRGFTITLIFIRMLMRRRLSWLWSRNMWSIWSKSPKTQGHWRWISIKIYCKAYFWIL